MKLIKINVKKNFQQVFMKKVVISEREKERENLIKMRHFILTRIDLNKAFDAYTRKKVDRYIYI